MKQPWAFGILSSVFTIAWVCAGCSPSSAPVVPTLPSSPPLATLMPTLPPSNTPNPTFTPPPPGPAEGQPTEQPQTPITAEFITTVSATSNPSNNDLPLEETVSQPATAPAEMEHQVALEGEVLLISGCVLGGGDTSDPERQGGPRRFEFEVQTVDGQIVLVTYTAIPPGPMADNTPEIRLDFHAGSVKQGDFLVARGTYEAATNSLIVAQEGEYIETYLQKP